MTTIPHPPSFPTFEGVVRLTRVGTAYVLLTIFIAIAALNTGNNALYIGEAFLLGALLLSGMASKGGLRRLEIKVAGIDEAWAGQPAHGTIVVHNRSRIWNVRDVVLVSDDFAAPILIPILKRGERIEVIPQFLFQRRGTMQIKHIDSYTRYPFGFFLKKRRIKLQGEVVVYPRLLTEEVARERFSPVTGEQSSANRPGPGSEIHGFRDYVRGDSLRHVYWKKSASLGRWIMKQTDLEAARSVHVVVDTYKPRHVSDDDFEQMISAAATFIHRAVQGELDVILTLPRTTLRAREAQSAMPLFRALALIEASREPFHQTLDRNTIFFSAGGSHDAKSA